MAGLSAKKPSSGSARTSPSARSALSPRSLIQSGSPTGATAASPSSAPRSTMTRKRGSRPSARAALGTKAQANNTPDASMSSRRDGAWSVMEASRSSALELRRHQQKRQRLLATFGAFDRLARLVGRERAERSLQRGIRVDAIGDTLGNLIGDVETLRQARGPGGIVVGEAFR